MIKWQVNDILRATGGTLVCGDRSGTFPGIGIDSRKIAPGELFVAIIGENHDGHRFVGEVLDKNARGLLVKENALPAQIMARIASMGCSCIAVTDTTRALGDIAAFHRRARPVKVVAITGSNGKTTTRKMTTSVVEQAYPTLSTMGNFNNEIGLPLSLLALDETHQAAVLELGMNHAGEIDRLAEICRPDIGIITNVGPAHLEFLGSIEGVARAKGELIGRIDPDGAAVLNADDPHVKALARGVIGDLLFFGIQDADADVHASRILESATGTEFLLETPEGEIPVRLNAPGRVMVYNALAAAAAGVLLGISLEDIKTGLERFEPAKGRMGMIQTRKGIYIIDDTYNANPESMKAALESLVILKGRRRGFFVAGDMLELGSESALLHREIGRKAAGSGVYAIHATGDHASSLIEGAMAEGFDPSRLLTGTKEAIFQTLKSQMRSGDWLLVKGSRGMAMETIVEAVRQWADGEEA